MLKNLHLDHHNQQNAGCAEFDFFREILCIHAEGVTILSTY